ncbi:hypothetical protein PybrP1_000410 [[Pythium] brassicae (nom. inval.)]|nr:hypothetical protein PybrP1_000410 [[Pythium] brassicae (nom. inval.)]
MHLSGFSVSKTTSLAANRLRAMATTLLRRAARAPLAAAASSSLQTLLLQVAPAGANSVAVADRRVGAVRCKVSERAQRRKNLRKQKMDASTVPLLKDTLRKLYLRTHPDLFGQFPAQRAQNEASYKELLGVLDSIEKTNTFPPARTFALPFALKTPVDGVFKNVELRMRTTGGACNTLVEEALGKFFVDCGLPAVFRWGEGSWGKAVGKEAGAAKNSNLDYDVEEEEARERERAAAADKARREAEYMAPAYTQVDRRAPEDTSIERVLNELNDVFEIIAAVPLMDEEEYGELREYYENGGGLDEIDERGYSIKAATEMIWKGERDMGVLASGVDADSAMIIQRILMHTLAIEQKVRELIEKGVVDEGEEGEEEEGEEDDDDEEEEEDLGVRAEDADASAGKASS